MPLFEGDHRAIRLTLGEIHFLNTLTQRHFTPFLLYLSTTCGLIIIREAQYVDHVVFNDSMKGVRRNVSRGRRK